MKISNEKLSKVASILKTIAHPTRLAIIETLQHHPRLKVSEICEVVKCEQSLLSHHLNIMRLKGILQAQKEGQNVFYSLKEIQVTQIISCLENCDCQL